MYTATLMIITVTSQLSIMKFARARLTFHCTYNVLITSLFEFTYRVCLCDTVDMCGLLPTLFIYIYRDYMINIVYF